MSKIFVRERSKIGVGAGQPRFRIVAAFEADLKVYVPHLRRDELEQLAAETGAQVVYLKRGAQEGEPQAGQGAGTATGTGGGAGRGHGRGRGGGQGRGNRGSGRMQDEG